MEKGQGRGPGTCCNVHIDRRFRSSSFYLHLKCRFLIVLSSLPLFFYLVLIVVFVVVIVFAVCCLLFGATPESIWWRNLGSRRKGEEKLDNSCLVKAVKITANKIIGERSEWRIAFCRFEPSRVGAGGGNNGVVAPRCLSKRDTRLYDVYASPFRHRHICLCTMQASRPPFFFMRRSLSVSPLTASLLL